MRTLKRILPFLFLVPAIPAFSQIDAFNGYCTQGSFSVLTSGLPSSNVFQNLIPQCQVMVFVTGTTVLAPIYADAHSTPLTNPFTATTKGQWLFFAADGVGYDVVMSGGFPPLTYTVPVTLTDLKVGGGGGGGSGTVTAFSAGNLPPLFTTSVANPTTTPALSFNLSSDQSFGFFGNVTPTTGLPSYVTLIQGTGITLTPSVSGSPNTLTIAATPSSSLSIAATSPIQVNGGSGPVSSGTATISCSTCGAGTGTVTNFKSQGTLLTGAFQPVAGFQTWDYDPVAISPDAGFVNATMKDVTASGKLDFEVPTTGTSTQMLISGLPAGQSAILWPTQKPSCTASGGGTINTCNSHVNYSAGADGACGGTASVGGCSVDAKLQNFQYCPSNGGACTPLPPGWSVGNITAEYLVAIFGGTVGVSAQVSLTCAHNSLPATGSILTSGLTQFSHVYATVIDPTIEVCDFLINHNPGNDGRINSGNMPLIAMVAFDASDPAPPPSGALFVEAPLSYRADTSTLSLSAPINAVFDFGAVNAYQGVSAIEVGGPKVGDTINLITGATNTGASTLAITNALSNIAYSIVRRSGATTSAVVAGDLPSGVPIPLIFDGLDWNLYSVGAAPPNSSLQYDCSGSFCGDQHGSTDGSGNLTLNTITLGDNSPGVASYIDFGGGTAPSAPPANTIQIYGPTSIGTSYSLVLPSSAPTSGAGLLNCSGSSTPFSCIWSAAGSSSSTVGSAEVVSFSATPTFSTSFNVSRIVLTGNITSFTLGTPGADGQDKKLCFKQGSGPFTVTAPANVHGFFTIGTVNADWNCQAFVWDNTDSIWQAISAGVINM